MDKIRSSITGVTNFVSNILLGANGDTDSKFSESSSEAVDCGSDCSLCATENQVISLPSSHNSSRMIHRGRIRDSVEVYALKSHKRLKTNNSQSISDG
jgi:hypothetical protein